MAYIEGHARDQALLLPASVKDYVSAANPMRFIDASVDDLDLGEAGFLRTRPKATGRPSLIRAICWSCICTAISTERGRAVA